MKQPNRRQGLGWRMSYNAPRSPVFDDGDGLGLGV